MVKRRSHTVRSLIRVDFPAPLGPTIPTRLDKDRVRSRNVIGTCPDAYLDSDNAQLTSMRLGSLRPGYVKVQCDIFRIARVLLRTPISEPGGGNENLIDVAARV